MQEVSDNSMQEKQIDCDLGVGDQVAVPQEFGSDALSLGKGLKVKYH